jgi:hypothetical protein
VLDVLGEPAAAVQPAEGALDDPPFRQHLEAGHTVGALDDLQLPAAEGAHGRRRGGPLVAAIGEDPLDEREQAARLPEDGQAAVAVLDIGRMDGGAQEQPERVDQDVPLAPLDLLARVVARRVGARPPFSALLTLWLSRIAALGLASRPARSRART